MRAVDATDYQRWLSVSRTRYGREHVVVLLAGENQGSYLFVAPDLRLALAGPQHTVADLPLAGAGS
jgi:hypothetical protein